MRTCVSGKSKVSPDKLSSCAIRNRSFKRKIELIALGLLMLSVARREVSEVPRGWALSISQKNVPGLAPAAKTRPSWRYWFPITEARFVHSGFSGSAGGGKWGGADGAEGQAAPTP